MTKKILATLLAAVLALTMGLVPAVTADDPLPDPPAWAECVTLYADQDIDVGTVCVWNDGTTLYVKYETSGDWVMTETHLAVGTDLADLPQSKKGNPIPGQFPEGAYYDPPVTEDTFALDLNGWDPRTVLYIAAHAVVVRPIEDCWEEVWMIGDVETATCEAGTLTNYANEFNWRKVDGSGNYTPVGDCEQGPGLNLDEPPYTDPFIVGATPTSEFPYNSNTVRDYATDFDVQWNGSLLFGGELTISWSPGRSATEEKQVSGDGIVSTTFTATGSSQSGQGWFMDTYPLVEHSVALDALPAGDHTINFQHTRGDGTFWDWVLLEKPCEQWETAWADGTRFVSRGNWATYFTYQVRQLLDLVSKNPSDWTVIEDGASGVLVFAPVGPTFDFVLDAADLQASTDYSLIYYADPWPGDHPGALIAAGTTDGDGFLHLEGATDLGMHLPNWQDENYNLYFGAKIWLVLSDDYNPTTNAMTAWNPTQYLFEYNLITYTYIP
ncbi:MAG: hypothetical protein ACLFVD_04395 [Dehalococcoidia bacterium]